MSKSTQYAGRPYAATPVPAARTARVTRPTPSVGTEPLPRPPTHDAPYVPTASPRAGSGPRAHESTGSRQRVTTGARPRVPTPATITSEVKAMPGDPLAEFDDAPMDVPVGGQIYARPGSGTQATATRPEVSRYHPRDQSSSSYAADGDAPHLATPRDAATSGLFHARTGHIVEARKARTTGAHEAATVGLVAHLTGGHAAVRDESTSTRRAPVIGERRETPAATQRFHERTREEHASAESGIRAMGAVFWLQGFALAVVAGFSLAVAQETFAQTVAAIAGGPVALGIVFAFGLLMVWMGGRLRMLDPNARLPGLAFAGVGLLAFPIGTVLSLYFLALLSSQKGRHVFSAAYREAREGTPEMTPPIAWGVWACVALAIAGVYGAFELGLVELSASLPSAEPLPSVE